MPDTRTIKIAALVLQITALAVLRKRAGNNGSKVEKGTGGTVEAKKEKGQGD